MGFNSFLGEPPQIKSIGFEGPQKVHYERGVTLKFYCKASGKPTFTWQCFKESASSKPEVVGHGENLEVVTTEATEGKYTCHVENDFGDERSSPPIEIKVGESYSILLIKECMK